MTIKAVKADGEYRATEAKSTEGIDPKKADNYLKRAFGDRSVFLTGYRYLKDLSNALCLVSNNPWDIAPRLEKWKSPSSMRRIDFSSGHQVLKSSEMILFLPDLRANRYLNFRFSLPFHEHHGSMIRGNETLTDPLKATHGARLGAV